MERQRLMDSSPSRSPATPVHEVYHNLIRLMVYLHQGISPAQAWPNLPKEPSFPQFKMLMMVRFLGTSNVKVLARALGISAASASEMLDRLVDLGLIDRRQDPEDRRRVQISLTRPAIKGVERHEALIVKRISRLMEQLGEPQAAQWVQLFSQIGIQLDQKPTA